MRGGKEIPLKETVDEALTGCPNVHTVFVQERTESEYNKVEGRDVPMRQAMDRERPYCPVEIMDSEDPLFLLYTSGSTGSPKVSMYRWYDGMPIGCPE